MLKKVSINRMKTLPDNKRVEQMKSYFQENPPVIGKQSPKSVTEAELNVAMLVKTKLPAYQRWFEYGRFKDVVNTIIKFGPSVVFSITVIKNGEILHIHDGRHTTLAYWVLGFETIPANIVEFQSAADEIQHFNNLNRKRTGTKYEQDLLNGFQAKEALPCLIYKLGLQDQQSKWSDKVGLLGTKNRNEKMTAANFSKIVNWAGLGLRRRREGESDMRASRKLEKLSYESILEGVNLFHDWFFNFATPIKKKNDYFHKDKVLISMLEFFYCAIRQDSNKKILSSERILNDSITRFSRFNWQELNDYDVSKAPDKLFAEFNLKRGVYPVIRIGIQP